MHTGHPSPPLSEPQTPELLVYPNRRRTLIWLLLGGVSSSLLLLGFLFVLIVLLVIPKAFTAGAVFAALLLLGLGGTGLWPTRVVAHLLTSGEPMLVITHQGVRVGKLYGSFNMVLPWEEITAIYPVSGGLEKQLCIRPTNVKLFLARFGPPMRFFLRINLLNGAPIALTQSFLDQPIEEIFQHLQDWFAQELDAHQVQLLPPRLQ